MFVLIFTVLQVIAQIREKKNHLIYGMIIEAVEAFAWHWKMFAKRYKGISSEKLSFNLVNEPPGEKDGVTLKDYRRAIEAAVKAIREVDPSRLIIVDGMDTGNTPCPELGDLGVSQSCRAYIPMSLTHYKARWWKDHQ